MEKISFNKACNNLKFNIYKIEVGVLWTKDEEHEDYDCYNNVYDKQYGYYDENVVFELDYNQALDYAKHYVENGVNGTYAIISKIDYDNEYYKLSIDDTLYMVQTILGGGYIEEYNEIFDRQELYGVNNIIYSLCKEKNKENPYYLGKGNGNIVENFIDKSSEVDYE